MPAITMRNVPEKVAQAAKKLAREDRRSLNQELLVLLEEAVRNRQKRRHGVPFTPERQRSKLQHLDAWEDSRSTEEIISDIYAGRTLGRDVSL